MEKLIERIVAESKNGKKFNVNIYQEFTNFSPLNGPSRLVPALKRAALDDGSPVNFIDDHSFKIVLTDEIIRKV